MLCILAAAFLQTSIDLPPMELQNLVPALGKKLGMTMACAGPLRTRVAMLSATGSTPQEVMDRLAEATGGEWAKDATGYVLARSVAADRQARERAIARRAQSIRATIEKAATAAASRFDDAAAQKILQDLAALESTQGLNEPGIGNYLAYQRIFNRAPGNRAIAKMLALINARDLATIGFGESREFTLEPKRYQWQLPAKAADVLADLRRELAIWGGAVGDVQPTGMMLGGDPRFEPHGTGRPAKAVLVFKVFNRLAVPQATLLVEDSDGAPLCRASENIGEFDFGTFRASEGLPAKDPDFTLPDDAVAFAGFFNLDYPAGRPAMSREWREVFLNPQSRDPLEFTAAPMLREAARRENKNLVAVLPDALITLPSSLKDHRLNIDGYMKWLQDRHDLAVTRRNGWIFISSADSRGTAEPNVDRDALHRYVVELDRTGMVTLDNLGEMSATFSSEDWDPLLFYYTAAIAPRLERLVQFIDHGLLRFYALLSQEQRLTLRRGGSLSVMNLPELAKDQLVRLILNSRDGSGTSIYQVGQSVYRAESIAGLPGELLGSGLAAGALVTSTASVGPGAIVATPQAGNYAAWTHVLSIEALPATLGGQIGRDAGFRASQIWLGDQLTLKIALPFRPGLELRGELQENRISIKDKPKSIDDLPDELRKKIEAFAKQAATEPGKGSPPPP